MALNRGPRDTEGRRRTGSIQLTAALAQHVLEEGVETIDVAEGEEALDVPREEGVHPFSIQSRRLRVREQRRGKASVIEALVQRGPEGSEFVPQHGHEVHLALPARERIAELLARRQRRRPGGHDPEPGEQVGADLQHAAGVAQLMDLVEDDDRLGTVPVEEHGIAHHVLDGGQVAIDVERPLGAEALHQGRLAGAAYAGQPGDGRFVPGALDAGKPEGTVNHEIILYVRSDF